MHIHMYMWLSVGESVVKVKIKFWKSLLNLLYLFFSTSHPIRYGLVQSREKNLKRLMCYSITEPYLKMHHRKINMNCGW